MYLVLFQLQGEIDKRRERQDLYKDDNKEQEDNIFMKSLTLQKEKSTIYFEKLGKKKALWKKETQLR